MSFPGHTHNGLLKDVTLDEMFRIGKEEGWSDEYIHSIWNFRRDFTSERQGWCEQCFRETFTKYASLFETVRRARLTP